MTRIAALDLGSNSFHLLDAVSLETPKPQLIYGARLREKVQLGAGLDADNNLSQVSINRGLDCIQGFHRYIQEHEIKHIISVATNTLRIAKNSRSFIHGAEDILSAPISIISGEEEARLIFLAVIEEAAQLEPGLVIDIGGGSTEFAIGSQSQLQLTKSIEIGCVSYYQRFFSDGKIYAENTKAAQKAARLEIEPHLGQLQSFPLNWVAGTSGTLQSIAQLANRLFGEPENNLSIQSLNALEAMLVKVGHVKALDFDYLDPNRRMILPSGLAIVRAIFDCLEITNMQICQTALCEGMLMELKKQLTLISK